MIAAEVDLVIERGADWGRIFEYKDPAGTAISILAPGYMDVRTKPEDETATRILRIASTGTTDGTMVFDSPAGKVTVTLTRVKTRLLAKGRYHYDLFVSDSLGKQYPLVRGRIEVVGNVSTETA